MFSRASRTRNKAKLPNSEFLKKYWKCRICLTPGIRVTRFGDISLSGRLFTLVSVFEICGSALSFRATFFDGKRKVLILTKKWAGLHFWLFYSQTHPVTLGYTYVQLGLLHMWKGRSQSDNAKNPRCKFFTDFFQFFFSRLMSARVFYAGLPDGLFSNQKSQFG
jgi:hypothetical protein